MKDEDVLSHVNEHTAFGSKEEMLAHIKVVFADALEFFSKLTEPQAFIIATVSKNVDHPTAARQGKGSYMALRTGGNPLDVMQLAQEVHEHIREDAELALIEKLKASLPPEVLAAIDRLAKKHGAKNPFTPSVDPKDLN